jgi:protein-S-isoprenylcysteine O-methyltransferase Ste14
LAWHVFALVGDVLLALIIFVWRPWVQLRRHGTWAVLMFRSFSLGQTVRDVLTVVMFVALYLQAILFVFAPQYGTWMITSQSLVESDVLHVAGAIVMVAGLVFLPAAQLHLGVAWRIGIDPEARLGLVTDGYYQICRNPIFMAILTVLVGSALLVPTLISLIIVVATYFWFRMQAAEEEDYLSKMYGAEYMNYASRVGRFTPFTGRLEPRH